MGYGMMGILGRITYHPKSDPAGVYVYLNILQECRSSVIHGAALTTIKLQGHSCEKLFQLRNTSSSIDLTNTLEVSVRTINMALGVEWGEGMA